MRRGSITFKALVTLSGGAFGFLAAQGVAFQLSGSEVLKVAGVVGGGWITWATGMILSNWRGRTRLTSRVEVVEKQAERASGEFVALAAKVDDIPNDVRDGVQFMISDMEGRLTMRMERMENLFLQKGVNGDQG